LICTQASWLRLSRVNAYSVKPRLLTKIVPTLVLRSPSFAGPVLALARVAIAPVPIAATVIAISIRLTKILHVFGLSAQDAAAEQNLPGAPPGRLAAVRASVKPGEVVQ
jgi:hypothetical protein